MSSMPTIAAAASREKTHTPRRSPKYPGIRVTCNGNQLVTQYVETRITEGGVFYPITPSTEGGEIYQQSYAQGELNVFGAQKIAIECEGEHAAQEAPRLFRSRDAARSISLPARASFTRWSSTITRRGSFRRWCWRSARAH